LSPGSAGGRSVVIVWRFTGARMWSSAAETRAQKEVSWDGEPISGMTAS
jgi:hypothetical protein